MLQKTRTTPNQEEAAGPLFRTPVNLFDNMLSELEGYWPKSWFRQMTRRFDKDLPWMPALDVFERDGELVLKADLPGLKKEDLKIYLEDGALVLQGERRDEKKVDKDDFYLAECSYGSFYRRLPLRFKADFDKVTAQFTDGVLEVHVPMPIQEPPKAQEIPVH